MAKARGGLRVPPRRGLRGEQGEGYWEQEEGEPCYVCGAGKRERGAWGNPETCPGARVASQEVRSTGLKTRLHFFWLLTAKCMRKDGLKRKRSSFFFKTTERQYKRAITCRV